MKSYLTPAGLSLLQLAIATLPNPPTLQFTGSQIGSAAGFVPTDQMTTAQGTVLVNQKTNSDSVRMTKMVPNEAIYTVIAPRELDFAEVGNVVFFINNQPAFWLVADQPFGKFGIDQAAHLAGDKCYLPIVLRFPYIDKLIAFDPTKQLHAKFPVFNTINALTVPDHTQADQVFIEKNNLPDGHDMPFFAARSRHAWHAFPYMNDMKTKFYMIDGGRSSGG